MLAVVRPKPRRDAQRWFAPLFRRRFYLRDQVFLDFNDVQRSVRKLLGKVIEGANRECLEGDFGALLGKRAHHDHRPW